jgi:YfiH family protein
VVGSQESVRGEGASSIPSEWRRWAGLTAGFGDRKSQPPSTAVRVRQVHGPRVIVADALAPGLHSEAEGDALVVRRGTVVAVSTADCVPILLVDPARHWAAAVHAGWKGTVARVVVAALDAARRDGIDPSGLYAALGPSIGPCCYEVGDDVARVFLREGLPVERDRGDAKSFIDLRRCNERWLTSAGLLRERIRMCGPCTRCRSDLYHSYRVHRGRAGRQLSWIGWVGPARQTDSPDTV